jgi:hypothetical protein
VELAALAARIVEMAARFYAPGLALQLTCALGSDSWGESLPSEKKALAESTTSGPFVPLELIRTRR